MVSGCLDEASGAGWLPDGSQRASSVVELAHQVGDQRLIASSVGTPGRNPQDPAPLEPCVPFRFLEREHELGSAVQSRPRGKISSGMTGRLLNDSRQTT